MKNKTVWIVVLLVAILIIASILFFYRTSSSPQDHSKEMQNTEVANPEENQNAVVQEQNATSDETVTNEQTNTQEDHTQVKGVFNEVELSNFSTPLKAKPAGRLNNIHITCDIVDEYVIGNGKTFSFNQVVGQPTAARGYQEADVIINGETQKAIGGGNCQVSSTIYNAALAVEGIEILERHEHGKDVSYVADGKDAAVSYGSLDLKFINKTGKDLKLYVGTDDVYVTAQIVSIS